DRIAGRLGSPHLADVVAADVPTALTPIPHHGPHAARYFADRAHGRTRIRTTLDRGAQGAAERALDRLRSDAVEMGIHNGVVVVAEARTGAVDALVGNFDFWDADHGGQIQAFAVPRSPGSTL